MSEHVLREGFSSYYVVKREEGYSYEEKIIKEQKCKVLLPFDIRRVDDDSYYYFKITQCETLMQKMRAPGNSVNEFKKMYRKLFDAVNEVEEFLLPPESILLEGDTIFMNEDELYFCYVPGRSNDLMQQLLDLTEEFLEIINYEDKSLVEFLYSLHEWISKGKLPNIETFDETEFDSKEEVIEVEEDDGEMVWEEQQEPLFESKIEVKHSAKWYVEVILSSFIFVGVSLCMAYEIYQGYLTAYDPKLIKIIIVLAAIDLFLLLQIIKKLKIRAVPEKFTTILTEDTDI